jgi:AcrR family transcriptional regulator
MPTAPSRPDGVADEEASVPLRERQRRTLRAEIQQAALRMFATHGYDNVTTEALAEEVGISPSTFFRHVPSKEHLLLAATQRGRAQIVANFHARPTDEDVAESLAAAILARTEQFVDDPEVVELWRRAMASAPAELRRASLLTRDDCDQLIAAVGLRLGATDGPDELRAGLLVRSAVAAVEYTYEWWLAHDQAKSLHDLTDHALRLVLGGISEPGPAAGRAKGQR